MSLREEITLALLMFERKVPNPKTEEEFADEIIKLIEKRIDSEITLQEERIKKQDSSKEDVYYTNSGYLQAFKRVKEILK